MFKSKKIILYSVMYMLSACANGPANFQFFSNGTDSGINSGGRLKGKCSTGAQKIVDKYIKVALSEKAKKRNDAVVSAIGQLVHENLQEFANDFVNELDAEDARKLLPLFYYVEVLALEAADLLPQLDRMSPSQLDAIGEEWAKKLLPLFFQLAEFAPAFEGHQQMIKEKQEVSKAELTEYVVKALDSFRGMREMVEAKARS